MVVTFSLTAFRAWVARFQDRAVIVVRVTTLIIITIHALVIVYFTLNHRAIEIGGRVIEWANPTGSCYGHYIAACIASTSPSYRDFSGVGLASHV